MIIVNYEGRTNSTERKLMDELSVLVSEKYFPRHKVQVTFKMMQSLEKDENIQGDTIWEDNDKEENEFFPSSRCSRPRCFTIRMQKGYDPETLITLIAHELVHVKQYVLGELRNIYNPHKIEYRTLYKNKDVTNWAYMKRPYEKEAYRLQEKLRVEYLKTHK
jgi:hypothetical protein